MNRMTMLRISRLQVLQALFLVAAACVVSVLYINVVDASVAVDFAASSESLSADSVSSRKVDLIVYALVSIGVGLSVCLAFFLYHTRPKRRVQVARRRAKKLFTEYTTDTTDIDTEDTGRHGAT